MRLQPGLVMPGGAVPVSLGKLKTYDDFVAHIATLATNGTRAWTSNTLWSAGAFRTTCASPSGGMAGTSWGAVFRGATSTTATARAVQHALPDEAFVLEQATLGREVFIQIADIGSAAGFSSLNKNGFTSTSSGSTSAAFSMTEILAWVGPDVGGYAIKMQPSLGLGPTPYTIP